MELIEAAKGLEIISFKSHSSLIYPKNLQKFSSRNEIGQVGNTECTMQSLH